MVRVKLTKICNNVDLDRLHPVKECAGSAIMNAVSADGAKPYPDLWASEDGRSEFYQDKQQCGPKQAAPSQKM